MGGEKVVYFVRVCVCMCSRVTQVFSFWKRHCAGVLLSRQILNGETHSWTPARAEIHAHMHQGYWISILYTLRNNNMKQYYLEPVRYPI